MADPTVFGKGSKATAVVDANGIITGVTGGESASAFDGAIGGIVALIDGGKTVYTGIAGTMSRIVPIVVAVVGTTYYTTGKFVPQRSTLVQ